MLTLRSFALRKITKRPWNETSSLKRLGVLLGLLLSTTAIAVSVGLNGDVPARPKISGIAFVRIKITDTKAAQGFYNGVLRTPELKTGCFGPSAECLFVNITQQIDLTKTDAPSTGRQIDSVGLFTSDVQRLRKYLAARGLNPGQLNSRSMVTWFQINDPENHVLEFLQLNGSGIGSSVSGGPPLAGKLIHAGWVVKDREVMDKFYRDVLGFRLYWQGGMKDDRADWVSMQLPDGTDWIEYMLNVPADASKHLLGVMNHIALGVPSVQKTAEQLKRNSVKLTEEPKIGRDGKWQLNLYDPDGTRVELMEFTPVEKPCCSEFTGTHPRP